MTCINKWETHSGSGIINYVYCYHQESSAVEIIKLLFHGYVGLRFMYSINYIQYMDTYISTNFLHVNWIPSDVGKVLKLKVEGAKLS